MPGSGTLALPSTASCTTVDEEKGKDWKFTNKSPLAIEMSEALKRSARRLRAIDGRTQKRAERGIERELGTVERVAAEGGAIVRKGELQGRTRKIDIALVAESRGNSKRLGPTVNAGFWPSARASEPKSVLEPNRQAKAIEAPFGVERRLGTGGNSSDTNNQAKARKRKNGT